MNSSGKALLDESVESKSLFECYWFVKKWINLIFCPTGEKFYHDPQFRGPLARRSCTDVICLLFFFVFLIAFGFAGYYGEWKKENKQTRGVIGNVLEAHREGDLNRLLVPRDSDGYQCGQDSEVRTKPYLAFFDLAKCADPLVPLNGCPTPQTCVSECPNSNFVHDKSVCQSDFAAYKKRLLCTRNVNMDRITNCNDVEQHINSEQCAKWYLKSEPCKFSLFESESLISTSIWTKNRSWLNCIAWVTS